MANTNLTTDLILNEAQDVLHQKLNFIGTINRQYDDSHNMGGGAKNGSTLRIRLPNKYTVTDGRVLNVQDTESESVTLTTGTQKHVAMSFSSQELTQDITLFSKNIIEPAMSVLAATMEADAMSMYKDVYQEVNDIGAAMVVRDVLLGQKKLTDSLALSSDRTLNLNTTDNVDLVDALKGLFNDPAKISENFREGMVANNFLGYQKVFENTLWPTHTTGSDDGTGDYLVNMAAGGVDGAKTLTVDTGAGTWKKGDIFTMDLVMRVHPESKESTGVLQRFVMTADVAASATSVAFEPAMVLTGGKQNISVLPVNNAKLNKIESDGSTAVGASADYGISMGYHKDAFAFATADLEMPRGQHEAKRSVKDGISMRIISGYDITNDIFPTRIDVLYGFKTIRPELAVRYGFN